MDREVAADAIIKSDTSLPPRLVLPDLPRGSMGWRMGDGEEALMRFSRYFEDLSPEAAQAFMDRHPAPDGWESFFDRWLESRTDD